MAGGMKQGSMSSIESRARPPTRAQVWSARLGVITALLVATYHQQHLQQVVDDVWGVLRSSWLFNSVYFETWWTSLCYPIISIIPFTIHKVSYFDQYKLSPSVTWHSTSFLTIAIEAVVYAAPLMLLDTFLTKRYTGYDIDPAEWQTRRENWVQYTRALPTTPPTVFEIFWHLVASLIIYDLLFFSVHYVLHKNARLYKLLHAEHHDHTSLHSRVTNQLSLPERVMLVLSANQALRILEAHPLTRMLFVPIFLWAITENHLGYDLPWTMDKIVPFGLLGGSSAHYAHHMQGTRNYQPFLTYIDKYLIGQKKQKSL